MVNKWVKKFCDLDFLIHDFHQRKDDNLLNWKTFSSNHLQIEGDTYCETLSHLFYILFFLNKYLFSFTHTPNTHTNTLINQ